MCKQQHACLVSVSHVFTCAAVSAVIETPSLLQRIPDGGGNGRKTKETSDFWWDIAGWVTLIGLGMGVMAMSKTAAAAGPPPPMPR